MKILNVLSSVAKFGSKCINWCSKFVHLIDRIIRRKEYEAEEKEKKRAIVYRVMLCVACAVLGALLIPYKIIINRKTGYIYMKSTLLTITNETPEEKEERLAKERGEVLDDDKDDEFDIPAVDDGAAECKVVTD